MGETVRIVLDAKRAMSLSYVTLSSVALDDDVAEYWWDKHLEMEEQISELLGA